MSITREDFVKELEKGNLGYYESVLRLTQRINPELEIKDEEIKDAKAKEIIIQDCSMREQVRIDRVTGQVEHIITSPRGAHKYESLVTSAWYKEAFGLDKEPNKLRVGIKEVNIDKIPDDFIVSVYYCYLNYYDCITYNDTAGIIDKRIESHQMRARTLFKELQDTSQEFDSIILDVMSGKYEDKMKQDITLEKPKRTLINMLKEKLFGKS